MKCLDPCRPQAEVSLQSKFNMQVTNARGRHTPTCRSFCLTGPPVAFIRSSASSWRTCHRQQISFRFDWRDFWIWTQQLSDPNSPCLYSKPAPHTNLCHEHLHSPTVELLSCPTLLFTDCLDVVFCLPQLSKAFKVLFSWRRSPFILLGASSSVCVNSVMYWCQCNIAGSNMVQTRPWGRPLDLSFLSLFCFP